MSLVSRSLVVRTWQVWLFATTLLLSACLPTLAAALTDGKQAVHRVAVCSAQGLRWVEVAVDAPRGPLTGAPEDAGSGGADLAGVHCPWCLAHATPLALASAPMPSVVRMPTCDSPLPEAALHGPRDQHAWLPFLSRAPPSLV